MAFVRRAKGQDAPPARVPPPLPQPGAAPLPVPTTAVVHTDPLNEIVILAAVVVDWEGCRAIVRKYSPDFFHVDAHKLAWEAIRQMHSRDLGWDPETLRLLAPELDVDYVLSLVEARPDVPPNLQSHLEKLESEKARVECAKGPLSDLLRAIDDPKESPERLRVIGRQLAASLDVGVGAMHLMIDPGQIRREVSATLDRRREGGDIHPFGIDELDYWDHDDPSPARAYSKGDPRLLIGTAPGAVTVITASSGSGKSTFTSLIAIAQANRGRRVAYAPWEPRAAPTIITMAVQSLGFSRTKFITGRFSREEQARLEQEVERLSSLIFFMRNPIDSVKWSKDGSHNERCLDHIEGFLSTVRAEIFIADLWDMAFRFEGEHDEREALNRQQAMAERLGVHPILLQQQKIKELEKGDQNKNKRPRRDLIKGSSAWVDRGDTILAPFIPGLFKDVPIDAMEIGILKQREGRWPLAIEFNYNPELGAIWGGRSIPVHGDESLGEGVTPLDTFVKQGRGQRKAG